MKKCILVICMLLFLMSLTACGSNGPDMPMEVTVDGFTIVLGKTTVKEMTDLGYDLKVTAMPDVAKEGDKFIPLYYSLDKGTGNTIFITACVPWGGSADITKETQLGPTEGIIKSVEVRVSATEKVTATYNGVDLQEMTFDHAVNEWGAKRDEDSSKMKYTITTNKGFISFQSATTSSEEFDELNIQLKQNVFDKMQKE